MLAWLQEKSAQHFEGESDAAFVFMRRRLVWGQTQMQFIHLINDLLASGSKPGLQLIHLPLDLLLQLLLSFESDVWALVKDAAWYYRTPTASRLVVENVKFSLSLLVSISHPSFLPDCLSSKFLCQLSMQRQQFYMNCLISSHNYCSYPCDNSSFLPFLVILLLWSALTDSERLLESG